MKNVLLILIFVVLNKLVFSQKLSIPFVVSHDIKIDGKFDEEVWKTAKQVRLDSITIKLFQTNSEIFIGVQKSGKLNCFTDLYFKTDSVTNLHASMQLGERKLKNVEDNVEWQWGNNRMWKANTVSYKRNADEKQPFENQVEYYEGQEFVILKRKFNDVKTLLLQVVIGDFVNGEFKTAYPGDNKWSEIRIK